MGKIILKKNGLETQFINGVDFTTLTPQTDVYYVGVDSVSGSFEKLDPDGTIIDLEAGGGGLFTGGTINGFTNFLNGVLANSLTATTISATTYLNLPSMGGGVIDVTYLELVDKITGSTLNPGTFYLITDFQTCYDQPDFDNSRNPITSGNYKQGPVEPLIILATSVNTISNEAYQSAYPNDKITYDWTYNITEVTNGVALGRISERVDDMGNKTGYDHRNILFKRYLESTGSTVYNVIFDNGLAYSEFLTFSGSSSNNKIGDNLDYSTFLLPNIIFGVDCSNNVIGVKSYNNTIGTNSNDNVIGSNFIGNTIGDNFESNEIGDYFGNNASFSGTPVQNLISSGFKYNKIGDYFGNNLNYPTDGAGSGGDGGNIVAADFQSNVIGNNTIMNIFGASFTGNRIGDYLSLNSFGNSSQDNIIGNYFTGNGGIGGYPNQIGNDFTSNKIGNYAVYNQIDEFRFNEIGNLFGNSTTNEGNVIYNAYNNKIGEGFGYSFGNTIYSDFFDNLIGNNFYNNFIGEPSISGSFRRNDIGNDFRENIVYSEFQNNEIGNQFNNNICGDEFLKNTLGNGFNNNKLFYFDSNKIGDGANGNVINDGFNNNIIGGYFDQNRISDANSNNIGSNFSNNRFGDGFGFYDTSDVTSRNYNTFRNALNVNVGNYIIGRELIMYDTVSNEYHKVVFTKWTQGGNGGGFKYTRELVFPSSGPTVTFERPDYSASTIDVIVPGVLEIKRDNNGGGIYNVVVEGSFNGSVSPSGTTWNSNFTSPNSGSNFVRNIIANECSNNEIIGSNFSYNDISNLFTNNQNIGDDFRKNIIKSEVQSVDFSTATYVYSNYNCEVFENSSNNNRLSYYDGSDVLNIVNITD